MATQKWRKVARVSSEDEAWTRLADYIRHDLARREWSQSDLATRAGVGSRTVTRLLSAERGARLPRTLPAIEQALGWPPGTARRILEGRTPAIEESPAINDPPMTDSHVDAYRAAERARPAAGNDINVTQTRLVLEMLRDTLNGLPIDAEQRRHLLRAVLDLELQIRTVLDDPPAASGE
jgi:transcriptional regulator with XRE-family HTH domain